MSDSKPTRLYGAKKYSEILNEGLQYIKDRKHGRIKSLKTPWLGLNSAGVNGLEWGSLLTIGARPGCLSGDTKIRINRNNSRGFAREYSLEELYYKFNGLKKPRIKNIDRRNGSKWDLTIPSQTVSYKKDLGYTGFNNIISVVESGIKNTYTLITNSGKQIRATLDHKFLVDEFNNYIELKDLKVGDFVICKEDAHIAKGRNKRPYRCEYISKMPYYPSARVKLVKENGSIYKYHRIKKTRAVYDAWYNGVDLDTFLKNVKSNPNHGYKFSNMDMDIHHINGNPQDDNPSNLLILTKEEHSKYHANLSHLDKLNRKKIKKEQIVSITLFGKEMTYDIEMQTPYHNFMANEFIVHNSGKTLIVTQLLREAHANNPTQDFNILEFQFEMGAKQTASRAFAAHTALDYNVVLSTTKELDNYSFDLMNQHVLDCQAMEDVGIQRLQINNPIGHKDMYKAVHHYYNAMGGKPLIVTVDHSWLIKKDSDEKEKINTLYNTVEMLMRLKNELPIIIIMITQLNRSIDETLRKAPGTIGNYPTSSDIFGGDALMQGSDMVIAMTRPAKAEIHCYGPNGYLVEDNDLFLHLLKVRNGANEDNILYMVGQFNLQKMIEVPEFKAANPGGGGFKLRSQRPKTTTPFSPSTGSCNINLDGI